MPARDPQLPLPPTAAAVPPLAPAAWALVPALDAPAALLVMPGAPASDRELVPEGSVLPLMAAPGVVLTAGALVPAVGAGPDTFADVPALAAGGTGLAPAGTSVLEPHAAAVTPNRLDNRNTDFDVIVQRAR
jgi:hypothetical protein